MIISAADENITSEYKECLEQQIWTADQVLNLLDRMVTCGYIGILDRAYKIFMPVSVYLCTLMMQTFSLMLYYRRVL